MISNAQRMLVEYGGEGKVELETCLFSGDGRDGLNLNKAGALPVSLESRKRDGGTRRVGCRRNAARRLWVTKNARAGGA